MSVISRSEEQPPAQPVAPRLAHAVTFVPVPADAGPAAGVPVANGAHVGHCDHPDCNGTEQP